MSAFRVAPSSLSTLYLAGYDAARKVEVLRSTDRGATWQERSGGASLPGCGITDLAVAPSDAAVVYVSGAQFDPLIRGCRPAVIRSADGGATWSGVAVGPPVGSVTRLAVDPRDPAVVYAATGDPLHPGDGVWKSTDGGRTWSQAGPEIVAEPPEALYPDFRRSPYISPRSASPRSPGSARRFSLARRIPLGSPWDRSAARSRR